MTASAWTGGTGGRGCAARRAAAALLAAALILAVAAGSPARAGTSGPAVEVIPSRLFQGEVARVVVRGGPGAVDVTGSIEGDAVLFYGKSSQPPVFEALLGIDLAAEPGEKTLEVTVRYGGGRRARAEKTVVIDRKKFTVQRLKLPKKMVELDEATLERVRREKAELGGALEDSAARRLWKGPFLMPAEGRISSSFGLRRILNGKPRSPHTGLDIGAPAGRAVRASNSGTVTLTGERYFSGLTVVIDHGLGLSTMYFHLSEVLVKEGERVERGQIIGRVGSTGRSTGPHLHWGVWLSGARVDPRSLMAATGAAAETGKTLEAAAEKPGATSPAATGPAGQPDR